MDYRKTYDRLIQKRRDNPITKADCYCETHHIVPRSEGGSDDDTNLVNLTAREHYIAHLLLARIYDDFKMWSAVLYMRTGCKKTTRMFKYSSRLYAVAREKMSEAKSGENHPFHGKHLSEEHRRRLSISEKGKPRPWLAGRQLSEEHKMKISDSMKIVSRRLGNKPPSQLGKHWFNDGLKNVRASECPEGFVLGRLNLKRGK